MKNTHGGVLLLIKVSTCNFNKSITPSWVFFIILNCTNGTKSRKPSQTLSVNLRMNAGNLCRHFPVLVQSQQ